MRKPVIVEQLIGKLQTLERQRFQTVERRSGKIRAGKAAATFFSVFLRFAFRAPYLNPVSDSM